MKIEKALSLVVGEYNQCKDNPWVRKPVSYALYKVWKWCDRNEKEKEQRYCDECEIAKYHNLEDDDSLCLNCEVEG